MLILRTVARPQGAEIGGDRFGKALLVEQPGGQHSLQELVAGLSHALRMAERIVGPWGPSHHDLAGQCQPT